MSSSDGPHDFEDLEYAFETDRLFFTEETPGLSMGRLDWMQQRHRAELIVFLAREGLTSELIKKALAFLEKTQEDMHFMLETGLGMPECSIAEPKKCVTIRHPLAAELEAKTDHYRDGEQFTFEDFTTLNGLEVSSEELEGIPADIKEIMGGMANRALYESVWSEEITEVMLLSDKELLNELGNLE